MSPIFLVGRVPLLKWTTEKGYELILTSLLEDLEPLLTHNPTPVRFFVFVLGPPEPLHMSASLTVVVHVFECTLVWLV